MCLRPHPIPPVPAETARVARAALPPSHPYLTLRDRVGVLFADTAFLPLFAATGQPAFAPWRLALVSLLQFAEHLSDRQAADQVRRCLDWKYLLGLELTDPGFHYSGLAEFRARLLAGDAEAQLFETLLTVAREQGLLRARGKQRTDATHVLAAVRQLNRLELIGETVRHALNVLAEAAPDWLREHSRPEWLDRYARPCSEWRLPQSAAARERLAHQIGLDGAELLAALARPEARPEWRQLPAIITLQQVWAEQFTPVPPSGSSPPAATTAPLPPAAGGVPQSGVPQSGVPQSGVPAGGEPESRQAECRYRTEAELPPPSQCCRSPYDPDARSGRKRSTVWTGYVVHLTESCEADLPLFITDVQTTRAGEPEDAVLAQLQKELAQRELLPAVQLVDAGYITGKNLRDSREHYQVDLLGPDQQDTSWQAQAQAGFAATDFRVEWEQQYVTCPGGKQSAGWREREDRGRPVIKVHFHRRDCTPCAYRAQCTHAAEAGRALTLPSRPVWEALRTLRARQETAEFRRTCQLRAGIEGTHSQAERRCGVRRCRYVGEAKVRLQHLLTAAALNLVRWMEWLQETPRARTRRSAFVRLMAAA